MPSLPAVYLRTEKSLERIIIALETPWDPGPSLLYGDQKASPSGHPRLKGTKLAPEEPAASHPPLPPRHGRVTTHAPFSTLTERTLRNPPRSPTFVQSLSSRQRRPWKSSSSHRVRQAGAGPGVEALLMALRTERAWILRQRLACNSLLKEGAGYGIWAAQGLPLIPPFPSRVQNRVVTGWVSAAHQENGEAARGLAVRSFICRPGLASRTLSRWPGVGVPPEVAESADGLQSALAPGG